MLEHFLLLAHARRQPADLGGLSAAQLFDAASLFLELAALTRERVVQTRILQRNRGLIAECQQELEIFRLKGVLAEAIIEVKRADDATRRSDRHAYHRLQAHGVDG